MRDLVIALLLALALVGCQESYSADQAGIASRCGVDVEAVHWADAYPDPDPNGSALLVPIDGYDEPVYFYSGGDTAGMANDQVEIVCPDA